MPNFTPNYNLKKPLQDEFYNVDDANGNMNIIDTTMKQIADSAGNADALIEAHVVNPMPHEFKDGTITYKWGLRATNGKVQFVYEEV